MTVTSRRHFLRNACRAGLTCSAGLLTGTKSLGKILTRTQSASSSAPAVARVYVDTRRTIAPLDRNLFGSFLEHLGRAIYEGIYDPGSKLSDADGFRTDVLEQIRSLGVPIIRYPGGNFVSGYNWLDGVGPKQKRPRVLDKAWNTLETNQFGTNEFLAWCKAARCLPLMGLNLGTGTPEEAAALVEYCNVDKGTKWGDLRREHGFHDPWNVQHWCLGNEMDGPWQIGHMTATEYGLKAADAARQMRYVDQNLKLIACGSSGPLMPTYLEWDREVLEQCYGYVDGLSLHRYLGNDERDTGNDTAKYLAMNLSMDRQIAETLAVCDLVRGRKRSEKKLWLSFDEWNVWYRTTSGDAVDGHRQEAPHLLEEIYNLEDALLVGGLMNTLMRNANRVKLACLAQLVNVIAPLMTNATAVLRQTIFYPYSWGLQFARGTVLDLFTNASTYEVKGLGNVQHIDAAGSFNPVDRKISLFFLNRDLAKPHEVEIIWEDSAPSRSIEAWTITGKDLKAVNTFEQPNRVAQQAFPTASVAAGKSKFELPAASYTVIQWPL
jgi:alpha-N-arabinofuranosidase